MSMTLSLPRSLTPYAAALRSDLTPTARRLIPILERKAKGHPECWTSNRTLAQMLGCCVKTIYNGLQSLAKAGLVEIVTDHTLNSYRRIRLKWLNRGQWAPEPAPSKEPDETPEHSAIPSRGIRQFPSAQDQPPPDPPIEGLESNTPNEIEKEAPADSFSDRGNDPPTDEERPEPESLAPVVEKARSVFGEDPSMARRVAHFAKQYPLAWIDRALGIVEARSVRRPDDTLSWGFVVGILRNWSGQGGPPKPPPSAEEIRERKAAERRAEMESILALL